MDQTDSLVARNILSGMASASVDLDQLAAAAGITKPVLLKRLTQGHFKIRELAAIAPVLSCSVTDLTRELAA
ncbi:helix-turn-helix domain-containing protein [Nocardia sp. NPDC059239]|uniref:helix-turn-helix domain-containing protein n=1 Tax=unclassified Nocardia TaxID=2637762 RepID=UPI0036B6D015